MDKAIRMFIEGSLSTHCITPHHKANRRDSHIPCIIGRWFALGVYLLGMAFEGGDRAASEGVAVRPGKKRYLR